MKYAIISVSSLVVIILALIYNDKRKRRKIKIRYEETISKLRNGTIQRVSATTEDPKLDEPVLKLELDQENPKTKENEPIILRERSPLMSKETELRLLKELSQLEEQSFFLQKDITLSVLAVKLNTNHKYVSYLINQLKGMDFSTYINSVRIHYILDKLQNNAVYLDYKIAHLAEECGYSSHSKFTEAFKSQTGLLPSTFIAEHKRNRTA